MTDLEQSVARVAEFVRQWRIPYDRRGLPVEDKVYGVHHDVDGEMAELLLSDLAALVSGPAQVRAQVAADIAQQCGTDTEPHYVTGFVEATVNAVRIARGDS